MALAPYRKIHSKNGSGRFVVSEGIAPAEALLPHENLPTLYNDIEDDRFEVVMTKGTILSLVTDANGDSRVVPANGDATNETVYTADTAPDSSSAGGTATADETNVIVAPGSTVIGASQYDFYRPFDKGTSQLAGFITHGYVEWPLVDGLNDDLVAGDLVVSDAQGRPVKGAADAAYGAVVGKVIAVEKFATNFDDGLLSYMQLPSDPGALKDVYAITKSGPNQGRLGIRANLDVENVVGAVRVYLTV